MKVRYSGPEKKIVILFLPLFCVRYLFHILQFYCNRSSLPIEIDLYNENVQYGIKPYNKNSNIVWQLYSLCWALQYDPFFLTLYYYRLQGKSKILRLLKSDNSSLYITTEKIGSNFIMNHPFSTIINARSLGCNVTIKNNCTIGNKNDDNEKLPVIGNNVEICANAVVFGDIVIGDNVIIGAGTVVNKNIPDNSIVVGNPFRILPRKN